MKKILLPALIAAVYLAGLAAPAAGSAQMVTAHDPQRVRALLDRWGYHPGEITTNGETPSLATARTAAAAPIWCW
jgi:Ni/Co efflux regulator RcnB